MDDFFDQLDSQLREISRRNFDGARSGRRASRRLRAGVVALATLSIAGTAIAATGAWRPILGEPGLGPPPTVVVSAPPASQLAVLGVLRRAQTPADRGTDTQTELRYISNTASGVRTAYIRLLSPKTGLGPAVLVPVARITQVAPHGVVATPERINALCLLIGDSLNQGAAKRCFTTAELLDGRGTLSLGTRFFGVVPDGVRLVSVRFQDGTTASAVPVSNFFVLSAPAGTAPATMTWTAASGVAQQFPL
jgi:hypothetical protein